MALKKLTAERLFLDSTLGWFSEFWSEALQTRRRVDVFSPALVCWLMLAERLNGTGGLKGALSSLRKGGANELLSEVRMTKPLRKKTFSKFTGGYSKARQRLPLEKVKELVDVLSFQLQKRQQKWLGSKKTGNVYCIDGTTFTVERTDKNLERYRPTKNQHGEAYSPLLLAVCAHDVETGICIRPEYCSYRGDKKGEVTLAKSLMQRLPKKSLIIMDRGFGVFGIAKAVHDKGHQVLVRLSSTRAQRFLKECGTGQDIDQRVVWTPTKNDLKAHPEYGEGAQVSGRFIRKVLRRNGFKPIELLLFTTSKASVEELIKYYRKRQNIENDFRSIKHVIGCDVLLSKTPDMLEKELLMAIASYNLVRALMAYGARELKMSPRELSFTGTMDAAQTFTECMAEVKTPQDLNRLREEFLLSLKQTRLPQREEDRVEPRKTARSRKGFKQMRGPRKEEREYIRRVNSEGK